MEPEPFLDRLAHRVIGAGLEVHRNLGPGYLESVYEKALGVELERKGISFAQQYPFQIFYKGTAVGQGRLDFLMEGRLLLELKAVESLLAVHKAQVLSSLRATDLKLGLLLNFNTATLNQGLFRVINTP